MARKTEAEKRAQKKYDREHKDEFVNYHLKVRKDGNELLIKKAVQRGEKSKHTSLIYTRGIKRNGFIFEKIGGTSVHRYITKHKGTGGKTNTTAELKKLTENNGTA